MNHTRRRRTRPPAPAQIFDATVEERLQMAGPHDLPVTTANISEVCDSLEAAILWIRRFVALAHPTFAPRIPARWRGGPLELGVLHLSVVPRPVLTLAMVAKLRRLV